MDLAPYCDTPPAADHKLKRFGASNIRLVSSNVLAWMQSTQIVKGFAKSRARLVGGAAKIGDHHSDEKQCTNFVSHRHLERRKQLCRERCALRTSRVRLPLCVAEETVPPSAGTTHSER